MIKGTKKMKLTEGVTLHVIQSEKFKTILAGVYFKRPILPVEASYNALLSRIMDHATRSLPSLRDLNNELEYLYGSVIVVDTHKYGNNQTIQIKMSFPNAKYLEEEDFYEKPIKILMDILFDPLVEDGGFKRDIFDQAKSALISEIEMRKDDKMDWAISNCIETMFEDENYKIHELGTIEWVKAITPQSLYEHLQFLLREAEIDIIVNGDIDLEEILPVIQNWFRLERTSYTPVLRASHKKEIKKVKYHEEKMDVTQGRLVMGYHFDIAYDDPRYTALFLASTVLGGGGGSKLFTEVREKESLCYTIFARSDKFKSIMLIYAGIDPDNYEKAVALIKREVLAVQNGDFTEDDLQKAKEVIISSFLSISDYQNSFINYYYAQSQFGLSMDLDKKIESLENATKAEVVDASKLLQLDTIAFINKED
ncbi:EF-P 5-aminopentanol modification-associated protein YfmF [Fusibacter ferrireducens]|uniref:Insulinase family protein n=1 Tax=Fusibacter ferrireducens TaxID=2785058 RepID=A0ABR9ZPN6_9FIRM|nr:pitrilysin family protein [Fusibacter ferrireducens]MBF4691594.1 insulinase family protein [Fusibacter ferrireducens]